MSLVKFSKETHLEGHWNSVTLGIRNGTGCFRMYIYPGWGVENKRETKIRRWRLGYKVKRSVWPRNRQGSSTVRTRKEKVNDKEDLTRRSPMDVINNWVNELQRRTYSRIVFLDIYDILDSKTFFYVVRYDILDAIK